jgi:hypothetical protein
MRSGGGMPHGDRRSPILEPSLRRARGNFDTPFGLVRSRSSAAQQATG